MTTKEIWVTVQFELKRLHPKYANEGLRKGKFYKEWGKNYAFALLQMRKARVAYRANDMVTGSIYVGEAKATLLWLAAQIYKSATSQLNGSKHGIGSELLTTILDLLTQQSYIEKSLYATARAIRVQAKLAEKNLTCSTRTIREIIKLYKI